VRLPAGYVADHVELGYAVTVHRAQGLTADAAFVLVRPGMSREALYVAMTRGRVANHAYVATDLPDHDHPIAPNQPERTAQQVLAAALAHSDAQTSATETLRARYDQAASLATLVPIHQTLANAANRQRWASLLRGSPLAADTSTRILASPRYGALVAALSAGEQAGHDTTSLLARLVADGRSPTPADGDPTAELHARVTRWLDTTAAAADGPALVTGLICAAGSVQDPELAHTLHQLEQLMAARARALSREILTRPPRWALPLGPPPRDPDDRRAWLDALTVIAGYRDLQHIDDDHILGPHQNTASRTGLDERRRALTAIATARRLARTAPAARPAKPTMTGSYHPPADRTTQR
jgi:hypothetical protein